MDPEKAEGWDRTVSFQDTLILLGTPISLRRYGFCIPHRIELLKEGNIVYKWDREQETRKELFFDEKEPARTYEGNQFCFLEYCYFVHKQNRFPETSELKGLDGDVIGKYREFLERIVE